MVETVKRSTKTARFIIEMKYRRTGVLSRGRILDAQLKGTFLMFRTNTTHIPKYPETGWMSANHTQNGFTVNNVPPPFTLPDGRILFSARDADYTIYPSDAGADCP